MGSLKLHKCYAAHKALSVLQDYYELGVILTRKKLYTQATKNLEKAKKLWDGEESDLAQVGVMRTEQRHLGAMISYGCRCIPRVLESFVSAARPHNLFLQVPWCAAELQHAVS